MTTLWRSLLRAGGTRIIRKFGKAMPLVGTAIVIGMTAYEIKKKGLLRGIVNTALDATPLVGTAKNVIEVFTGDWLADKDQLKQPEQKEHEKPKLMAPAKSL